jgi:hypothetical protein
MTKERIAVENVGQPGKTYQVDAAKYAEMRAVFLAALPMIAPGLSVAQIHDAVRPNLSGALFPNGETCGWWVKCVQLDLEAKGIIQRAAKSPVRLWRVQ